MGLPVTVISAGAVRSTLVTVPEPPPEPEPQQHTTVCAVRMGDAMTMSAARSATGHFMPGG